MRTVTVTDLHTTPDPQRRLAIAAAGADRMIVRVPDRATDGVRAFRADDIARMLHRHGRLREIEVTDGGNIVAACEVTERRGEVAVWTGYAIGPWSPADIVTRGLGGSETAAVRLSEHLAAMGYAVTLYGQFEPPSGMGDDVMLRDFRTYDPTEPLHAFIGFRDATRFDHRPNAEFCALWLEDLAPAEGLTPSRAANVDRVIAVSHWHKGQVQDVHPWIQEMKTPGGLDLVAAARNGIQRAWFEEDDLEREKRVIYSSSPDRGGDVILEVWPEVREQVPDAELLLTYPRWFDLCADRFRHAADIRDRLRELLEQPGVRRIEGGMGQRALAKLMGSSLVWCHPSFFSAGIAEDGSRGVKFCETSCISALEAQAAGCVVVASDWGALSETVQHGTLIKGDPREKDGAWRHAFVEAIVRGLTDEQVQETAQTVGPEMVRDMGWRGAAEQLAAMFPTPVRANL
jgi:glycosyltransferase involved in cell wall biosynthesis